MTSRQESGRPVAPIKVLFVAPTLGGGGAEKHLLRVLNHLDRRQIAPSLAVVRRGGAYESMLAGDVPIHGLYGGRLRSSTLSAIQAVRPLRRQVQQIRPTMIVGVLEPMVGMIEAALGTLDPDVRPLRVAWAQNNFAQSRRDAKRLLRMLYGYVERGFRNADLVIALSRGVADNLRQHVLGGKGRIAVIHNAAFDQRVVDNSRQPCPLDKPRDQPLLVACGRLVRQKGYPHLLRAVRRVCDRQPVQLWILGSGPEETELRRQCAALHLQTQVRFCGFQENPYCYFRQADLFVLSSLWEGFGNVIVEAMSCGVPALATRCPYGPDEIITDGVNGFLVDPADDSALAQGILRALSNRTELSHIAAQGARRARDFDSATIAGQYQSALCELASRRPCGGSVADA